MVSWGHVDGKHLVKIALAEEVTFINKEPISTELDRIPVRSEVEIDVRRTKYLDNDIIEIINDFLESTTDKEISTRFVSEKGVADNPKDILKVIG